MFPGEISRLKASKASVEGEAPSGFAGGGGDASPFKAKNLLRKLLVVEPGEGSGLVIDGKRVVNLSSNNYLGLSNHPRLKEASIRAIERYGAGAGASRLISGHTNIIKELEERIAGFKSTEAALVFGSGYLANIGIIPSIAGEGDVIVADRLNHASIFEGCRISRARLLIYKHKDTNQLEEILKRYSSCKRRLVITDGLFSMDGDIAPLKDIVSIAKRYGAMVMIDDAHATGVLGKSGRGTMEYLGIKDGVDIQMGTLSKAIGCYGGYVAGNRSLIDYLINRARSFIFTTALPPAIAAAAIAAFDIIEEMPWLRERLWENRGYYFKAVTGLGLDTGMSESQIIPIMIGDEKRGLEFSERLLELGVYAPVIRPPTVPKGKTRIRTSIMATHTKEEIDTGLEALKRAGRELGIIS